MEPAGLTVGIIGLTALLDGCISAFGRIDTYQQYGTTSRQLETRFKNQKFLLQRWAIDTGLSSASASPTNLHVSIGQEELGLRIRDTLLCINEGLRQLGRRFPEAENQDKSESEALSSLDDSSLSHAPAKRSRTKVTVLSKLKWAGGGKEHLTEQVEWFENMVQTLTLLMNGGEGRTPSSRTIITAEQGLPTDTKLATLRIWLDVTSPSTISEHCTSCRLKDTCAWIYDLPDFKRWLDPNDPCATLWLHAPPGYGKSVASTAIAEHLNQHYPHRVLSYFCSTTQESLQMSTNILCFCISEAASRRPELFEMADKLRSESHSQNATETDLWSLFDHLVRSNPGFFIIVDGFDECRRFESETHERTGSDREALLSKLVAVVRASQSRLIVLSRDEDDIRSAFSNTCDAQTDVIEHKMHQEDISQDIARFATHQVQVLSGLAKRDVQLQNTITQHLVEKSGGMFLWVRLQSYQLAKAKTVAHLKNQMLCIPPGLDNFYERDWRRIQTSTAFERSLILKILQWVVSAVRPLTAFELFEMMAIQEDHSNFTLSTDALPDGVLDRDSIQSHLTEPCRPFLTLQGSTGPSSVDVRITHDSMKQFLLNRLKGNGGTSDTPLHDNTLAMTCVGYLSAGLAWKTYDSVHDSWRERPFFSYAASFWMLHLDHAKPDHSLLHYIETWFSGQGEHWTTWRDAFERYEEIQAPLNIGHNQHYTPIGPASCCYYAALFGLLGVLKTCLAAHTEQLDMVGGRHGTAVQAACAAGHGDIVRYLLDLGADVNISAGQYGSVLNAAASTGDTMIVRLLLTLNADLTLTDSLGANALFFAAQNGHLSVAKQLIAAGIAIDSTVSSYVSPLHAACAGRHCTMIQLLLEAGADINVPDQYGYTPIGAASYLGHPDVVAVLLRSGAEADLTDQSGSTPINTAIRHGYKEIAKSLLEYGADLDTANNAGWTPLHNAAVTGHTYLARLLIAAGADLDIVNRRGWTALTFACMHSHVEVTRLLIDAGADTHIMDDFGCSLVYLASSQGHHKIVDMLLRETDGASSINQFGSRMNLRRRGRFLTRKSRQNTNETARHESPWMPIHVASISGHAEVVQVLLSAGSDCDVPDRQGKTPLYLASLAGHLSVVQLLLDHTAEPNVSCGHYGTALHAACHRGHEHLLPALLSAGCEIDAISDYSGTALQITAFRGDVEMLRVLLDEGANAHIQAGMYSNLWNTAMMGGNDAVIQLLRAKHVDSMTTSSPDALGRSLLHLAAMTGSRLGIQAALDNGTDINMADNQGWTAMHWCAYFGHTEILQLLQQHGANHTSCDWQGWSPIQVASFSGHEDIVEVLAQGHAELVELQLPAAETTAQCDACDHIILATQHHCIDCPDFDLCFRCYRDAQWYHPGHAFVIKYAERSCSSESTPDPDM